MTPLLARTVLAALAFALASFALAQQPSDAPDLALELDALTKPAQGVSRVVPGEGPGGRPALRVRAVKPDWNGLLTRTFSLPESSRSLDLAVEMKLTNVVGSGQSFTKARAFPVFLNASGKMVGGWPPSLDEDGTFDWKPFSRSYPIPGDARFVTLNLGLYNAIGLAQYSGLTLTPRNARGDALRLGPPPPAEERTDTTGWRTFQPGTDDPSRELVVDIPALLGRTGPAGAHGFIRATPEGDLAFADGTPVRFWGTNYGVAENWRPAAESAIAIERLRRLGFNLVRLHHLDAGWAKECLFDTTNGTTQQFEPGRLDRFQKTVAQLHQAGLYTYVDLLVTRKFTAADGVRDAGTLAYGAKIAAHFNRRLIDLQKQYARDLLGTVNPYTGLTLAKDPGVAFVGIINESSLFLTGSVGSYEELPPSYVEELAGLYTAWLKKQNLPPDSRPLTSLIKSRDETVAQFLSEVQDAYYTEMRDFLRNDLGVKAQIIGSNFQENVADARSNARLDTYDVHIYWDHPQGGWGPTNPINNNRLLDTLDGPEQHAPFYKIARQQFRGLPLFVSEWQSCWPNETRFEAPLLMATIASLQRWDGMALFTFANSEWSPAMSGVFEDGNKPNTVAILPTAALLYLRGDVAALPAVTYPLGDESFASPGASVPASALFSHAVQVSPDVTAAPAPIPAVNRTADNSVNWDGAHRFSVATPRASIMLGDFQGKPVTVGPFTFTTPVAYAQVGVISLDGEPFNTARRLLVHTTARAENTGMIYRSFRAGVSDLGAAPILLEPVTGTLSWQLAPGESATLTPLDWHGRKAGPAVPLTHVADSHVTLPLDLITAGQALIEITR